MCARKSETMGEEGLSFLDEFSHLSVTDDMPSLSQCVIKIQGPSKTGKSGVCAGNPDALICHFNEGKWSCPATLAKVYDVAGPKDFFRMWDRIVEYAHTKEGRRKPKLAVVDPLVLLVDMFTDAEVVRYNKKLKQRIEKAQAAGEDDIPVYSDMRAENVADIKEYGSWDRIRRRLKNMILPVRRAGWGVAFVVHMKPKMKFVNGAPRNVLAPDIPDSLNEELNKYVDVRLITSKETMRTDSGKLLTSFKIEFESTSSDELVSRVPMRGEVDVPNYFSRKADPSITAWKLVNDAYLAALHRVEVQRERFRAQHGR